VAALVIAFGAIVGGVSGCAATFPLLSGTDADAFSYLAMFLFLGFVGALLGAGLGFLLWRFANRSTTLS